MTPYSRDIFWERTNKAEVTRAKLKLILLVCGANVIMLLSHVFGYGYKWWLLNHPIFFIIISFIYLLNIFAYEHASEKSTLFSDAFNKFKCWRDFYTSKAFVKSREDYEHAPISNGDYLLLWHEEDVVYMRYEIACICEGRSFFEVNKRYSIDIYIKDLSEGEILYHSQKHNHFWCLTELLFEIQQKLETDGYIIKAVYNKFGDLRWEQSDTPQHHCKIKKHLYNLVLCAWHIICFIAAIAPIAPSILFFLSLIAQE